MKKVFRNSFRECPRFIRKRLISLYRRRRSQTIQVYQSGYGGVQRYPFHITPLQDSAQPAAVQELFRRNRRSGISAGRIRLSDRTDRICQSTRSRRRCPDQDASGERLQPGNGNRHLFAERLAQSDPPFQRRSRRQLPASAGTGTDARKRKGIASWSSFTTCSPSPTPICWLRNMVQPNI